MNIDTQPGFINYENVTISYRIYMFSFYRAAWNAERGLTMRILSVCLSVRPSVRPSVCLSNACIVTKRKKAMFRFLYRTKERLS